MKKLIAFLLSVIMAFSLVTPASAALTEDVTAIVTLRGDGVELYARDENGNQLEKVYPFSTDGFDGKIGETAKNILIPFITEGLLFDKWDNYYKVCYDELSPLMKDAILDNNARPLNNSGIGDSDREYNATNCFDDHGWNGYGATDYTFYYDWRLSPFDNPTGETKAIVDLLHDYIVNVSNTTGKKITLVGNCLGGSYVLAYLYKYGDAGYVKKVFFNATVGNSTAILTDIFCGDIELDAKAIQRFADEYIDADADTIAGLVDTAPAINALITTTLDLFVQLGLIDKLGLLFDDVYNKVYEVLVPMLVMAFFGTMPGYWTMIEPERLEEAKDFVFGPEGSEYRIEYAGVEAKIDDYFEKVGSKEAKDALFEKYKDIIHFGATAKYGVQMYPFVESQNQLADEMADLYHASFGATVAETVYDVLPTSHIDNAMANGTEKYISPDKQIDASTSRFKDSVWFEKNMPHNAWVNDYRIIEAFARYDHFTVWDDPENYPQFSVRLPGTGVIDPDTGREDPETSSVVKLTAENKNESNWNDTSEDTKTKEPSVATKLIAFFRWLTAMINFILHISNDNPGSLEDALN